MQKNTYTKVFKKNKVYHYNFFTNHDILNLLEIYI